MTAQEGQAGQAGGWSRLKGWLADLGRMLLELLRALGRALRRGWIWLRPHVLRALDWLRPRARAVWAWSAPRGRLAGLALWTWSRGKALGIGRWARAVGPRLRRPLVLTARTLLMAALVGGLVLSVGRGFVRHVPPGTIAVRHVQWGGAGVIQRDYGPGLHRTVAGRDTWHHLRAGTHLVSFASQAESGSHPPLEVATREGEAAQVAVLVPYHIKPGSAWRLVADGLRNDYAGRAVAICRRVLLEELAALSAADFADPEARTRVEGKALTRLGQELGATHLEPLDVRIGSVFFDSTYEKKMLEKALATQAVLTNASLALRKQEQRENDQELQRLKDGEAALIQQYALRREELRDEHERAVAEISRQAKRLQAERRATSEVEVLRLENRGELALAAAEDLRQTLHAEALESTGGRLHIAREAAENLRFGKVTLNSNDPRVPSLLDLDELVALLMGEREE